jgi:hypothetical protein
MEIALLKSKNQFVLKTNLPTHTPFFFSFSQTQKRNQPTTEKQQQQQLLQNWHYFFKNKTSKQTNKLTLFMLSATSKFFCPSMLSYPQLKSPINFIPQ